EVDAAEFARLVRARMRGSDEMNEGVGRRDERGEIAERVADRRHCALGQLPLGSRAHERAHRVPARKQLAYQGPPDVARAPGDENPARRQPRLRHRSSFCIQGSIALATFAGNSGFATFSIVNCPYSAASASVGSAPNTNG